MFDHVGVWHASGEYCFVLKFALSYHVQAASKYNYEAICGIYFIASIGLGGNIPIDATITLEFLPQNKRYLVSLLSMWQPIGVVVACAISYGTAARYRCDVSLPACNAAGLGDDEPCCTVSSNMGWRYGLIIIGCMTLAVFFARFLVFRFWESPKFLLSRGREQEAIDVLHKIAKFNGMPAPILTVEDFRAVDYAADNASSGPTAPAPTKVNVLLDAVKSLRFLRGLFLSKVPCFTFVLLAIAYMVSFPHPSPILLTFSACNPFISPHYSFNTHPLPFPAGTTASQAPPLNLSRRATTGPSISPAPSCPSSSSAIMSTPAAAPSPTPTANTSTSTFPAF